MKSVTEINRFKIFTLDELSETAKNAVKEDYLEVFRQDGSLTNIYMEKLSELFPNSDLKIQYSLSSCQGDGVNIYGTLHLKDMLTRLEKVLSNGCIGLLNEAFTDIITDVELPENRPYSYCICDKVDFYSTIMDALEDACYSSMIAIDDFVKCFDRLAKNNLYDLCAKMEKQGYDYLYEVDMDEIKDAAKMRDWMFLEDGQLYVGEPDVGTCPYNYLDGHIEANSHDIKLPADKNIQFCPVCGKPIAVNGLSVDDFVSRFCDDVQILTISNEKGDTI